MSFFNSEFKKLDANPKKQWAFAHDLIDGKGRYTNELLDTEDEKVLADAFNDFFRYVGTESDNFKEKRKSDFFPAK